MSEILCPLCNAQSPENALYCQQCGQPLRCQDCGAGILPTARACIQCGKAIPERSTNDQFQVGVSIVPPGYNRLKLHETPDVRDLDLTVSNEAIAHIGDLLPTLVATRPKGLKNSSVFQQQQDQSESSSKRDYTTRLVHLFLYAKYLLGEEAVPRTDVYEILDDVGLKDGNTAYNIGLAKGISSDGNETLRLNLGGRRAAQEYIKDVFNPDLTDGWSPGADTRSTSTKVKKQPKKGSDQQNTVDADVARWASQEGSKALVDKVPHEKASELSILDKSLLALYGIAEAGIKRAVPVAAIVKYLFKAFKVEVKPGAVSRTIYEERKHKTIKATYFTFDGHGYEISPSGRNHIENLLNLKNPLLITPDSNAGSNGATQP